MRTDKLVLCRPSGGLNDMLCQIERVCRYCDESWRVAVIDTATHRYSHFGDPLSRYFVSLQPSLILDATRFAAMFDTMDVVPSFLRGRVNSYKATFSREAGNYIDPDFNEKLSFDFSRQYDEPLLVHDACGGGGHSIFALARMRLADALLERLRVRLKAIGGPFTAIHIRHTDYATDYERHIDTLKPSLRGPIFLATDNLVCVDYCKAVLSRNSVFSFTDLTVKPGTPLHHRKPSGDPFDRNADAILDLIMLAMAKDYFFFPVSSDRPTPQYSGFSMLAQSLRERPKILDGLLGE